MTFLIYKKLLFFSFIQLHDSVNTKTTIYPPLRVGKQRFASRYISTLGGEHKAKQNHCRELGVLPKFQSKNFLKIQEYLSVDDFKGKKRLRGV